MSEIVRVPNGSYLRRNRNVGFAVTVAMPIAANVTMWLVSRRSP